MRISNIALKDFRIYYGKTSLSFAADGGRNISIIAGKNGFGKTTFLTSLLWVLYGKNMVQVEEKYKADIRHAGGYEKYSISLLNKNKKRALEKGTTKDAIFYVELKFEDILIPSVPCKEVVIKRSFDYSKKKEELHIFIDGQENELTKEVGYEVFINDFILPREIAKFFFFDAEKVVTLAEAKTTEELRSLSKAYSEVLGIKKYEDLKKGLKVILTKLKRAGASELDQDKLNGLLDQDESFTKLIEINERKQTGLDEDLEGLRFRVDQLQEQLIREGNAMTLEELKELKSERDQLTKAHEDVKGELKKLMDIVPLVIAGPRLKELVDQLDLEQKIKRKGVDQKLLKKELTSLSNDFNDELKNLSITPSQLSNITKAFNDLVAARQTTAPEVEGDILLDYDDETTRSIKATYHYIQTSFKTQFEKIVTDEKNVRLNLGRIKKKIKAGEARKDNPIAKQLRADKQDLMLKLEELSTNKGALLEELAELKQKSTTNHKLLSEEEKNFKAVATDLKKYEVTKNLLEKLTKLTSRIKEEKKYSLQNAILLGLNKLMHKDHFVAKVNVLIDEEVMDIDLIDQYNQIIDKDTLSKGEQQLYATALLKALVDQSGIDFPVFIDSPLQKFDKEHSSNVIQQFYPGISEQVVLFPLLEKELTKAEYELLKPNLNKVFLIENSDQGSNIQSYPINQLFNQFNKQHVLAH
jgi:DNA sulfur modification protein DndD